MLALGHINLHVKRALQLGYNSYDVLRAACIHPVEHYRLPVGTLRVGDKADFIVIDDLDTLNVLETWVNGTCVARNGNSKIERVISTAINSFVSTNIAPDQLRVELSTDVVRTIVAHDGQLVTSEEWCNVNDPAVQKLVVVNRYSSAPPAIAYIKGFGLNRGALASSVAHDSHNVVAVGCSDADIAYAINAVMNERGGISIADSGNTHVLPLPVAGLMSLDDGYSVASRYTELTSITHTFGSQLRAPFMTLSFMALLVIPQLKLSDKGLFDGSLFTFVSLTD